MNLIVMRRADLEEINAVEWLLMGRCAEDKEAEKEAEKEEEEGVRV